MRSSGGSASWLCQFQLDPFSITCRSSCCDRRIAWRAEDERHHAGHRPRTHKLVAARYTFRRLFLAGLKTALLADAVGFAVLMVIDIPVIRDLAVTASIGVAVLIFTNPLLLPVLLSHGCQRQRGRALST